MALNSIPLNLALYRYTWAYKDIALEYLYKSKNFGIDVYIIHFPFLSHKVKYSFLFPTLLLVFIVGHKLLELLSILLDS